MAHKNRKRYMILSVIVLGSLLGFSEVVLGDLLSGAGFIARAGVLVGVAYMLAAFGMAVYGSAAMLIGIAGVAVLCKQIVVPVLGVSVMCKANSCLALFIELGSLAAISVVFLPGMRRRVKGRMAAAAAAAGSSAAAFFFIGMRLAPCKYLLSYNSLSGFGRYMIIEASAWVFFAALLFPLGWRIGERFSVKAYPLLTKRPSLVYYGGSALTVLSWALCFIFITLRV